MARNSNIDVGGANAEKGWFTQAIRYEKLMQRKKYLYMVVTQLGIKIVIFYSI
jgi:hypothetical protein